MIHVKGIDWQPIEAISEDRKDGRDMLLWDREGALVGAYGNGNWAIDGLIVRPIYWADIDPPVTA